MNDISLDLSGKIEKQWLNAIIDIADIAQRTETAFVLVGAVARDLIDKAIGVASARLTRDIDLAVRVAGWSEFKRLSERMVASTKFRQGETPRHRFYHIESGTPIDIVPFGPIAGAENKIEWPEPDHTTMSTLGFAEAYENSISVKISENPEISIRVATRPGLVVMKLIAWNDNRPKRLDDAQDMLHVILNYLDQDNIDRLYTDHSDIAEAEEFDFECAGSRLLGRDMALFMSPESQKVILEILGRQISGESGFRLANDMAGTGMDDNYRFEQVLKLLKYMNMGIKDKIFL